MQLVNLTPHLLTIVGSVRLDVPSSGTIARLAVTREVRPDVVLDDGTVFAVARPTLGEVTGIPAPVEGTIYIVSALVAEAAKRGDVMSPGELLRDSGGVVIGCKGLSAYAA